MGASELPDDVELLQEMVRQYEATVTELQRRVEQLEQQLAALTRRYYGPRRERFDDRQQLLFEVDDEPATEENLPARRRAKRAASRGHGRRRLPVHLLRKRIEYELPSDQLACSACGRERTKIGEETSEQLEYKPASLFVIQHVRFKYACRKCEECVTVAKKPPQPINKGLAGPGLLAYIIVSKHSDHLPLYRLEEILSRHGVRVSRSTMCGWMRACAQLLRPLYDLMTKDVLKSAVIHTDDTTVPVLDRTFPRTKTARFWVYVGDADHPFCVYDYTPSRSRDGPEQLLQGFRGYLQADAFAGYNRLYAGTDVTEVACWAHTRRKFYDARLTAPQVAHDALARIGQLYDIEKRCKALSSGERYDVRQKDAAPLLESFGEWLTEQRRQVLPKSPIRQAVGYAISNWTALCRYTEAGFLSIDNNLSERMLRAQAIGRKNWLFAGSDVGGETAAVLFSFVASCKHNGVDPYAYFVDVLSQWKTTKRDAADFLPDRWRGRHPEARIELNRSA